MSARNCSGVSGDRPLAKIGAAGAAAVRPMMECGNDALNLVRIHPHAVGAFVTNTRRSS
jgi:hypothetical protein